LEPAVPRCGTDFASPSVHAFVGPTWAITLHPRVAAITPEGVINNPGIAQIGPFRKSFVTMGEVLAVIHCTKNSREKA
jgi:hypothetical protein